jgi:hypothetical protein
VPVVTVVGSSVVGVSVVGSPVLAEVVLAPPSSPQPVMSASNRAEARRFEVCMPLLYQPPPRVDQWLVLMRTCAALMWMCPRTTARRRRRPARPRFIHGRRTSHHVQIGSAR